MPFHERHLYVDPGIQCTGLALFQNDRLVEARAVPAANVQEAMSLASYHLEQLEITACTIEIPQVYGAGQQKGDQNDLISLALVAGAWAGICEDRYDVSARFVRPAEWKGQVPKAVMHARLWPSRTRPGALGEHEGQIVRALGLPKRDAHNVYDAVCMGLKFTGRM